MLKPAHLAILSAASLLVAACGNQTEAPEPAGEPTAAQMPDTTADSGGAMNNDPAPDAGATGAATPTTTPPDPNATTGPTAPPPAP